jgi:hypothetical protein
MIQGAMTVSAIVLIALVIAPCYFQYGTMKSLGFGRVLPRPM